MITNNVVDTKTIEWSELKNYEFNSLKSADNRDITKLKNAIVNSGFNFPFYVWHGHRYVIDGKGRDIALHELEKEGHEIPPLPIIEIKADNKAMAKRLALQASSNHGQVTPESFADFTIDLELEPLDFDMFDLGLGEFELDPIDIGEPESDSGLSDEKYTMKTDVFTYEPTGEQPQISELYENKKANELLDHIEKSDIPEEIKLFLRLAAYRHIVFDFGKIANYYAHSNAEIQQLMENSAMIIIDYNDAISGGFVQLTKELQALVAEND